MLSSTEPALLEQAQRLSDEAYALLDQGGLLDIIQQAGHTFISGSLALNLMVRRDVDVYVQLTNDLDIAAFFALGAAITGQFQVLKASYSNHFIRNLPEFDHGLYWGIQLIYQNQPWKLDLWGYGPQHFRDHCRQLEELQQRLAPVERIEILRLKTALREGDHYRDSASGYDIYTAILTAAVKTPEQFENWWKGR